MILTVTLDPLVEHCFPVKDLQHGRAYRPPSVHTTCSGRALNVARALNDLGEKVVAVTVAGGRRGRELEERLLDEGLPHRIVGVRRETRVGATLYGQGTRTTVYGPRPALSDPEVEAIIATIRGLVPARCVVLGGGASRPDLYRRVAALGVPLVLDSCGAAMHGCLKMGNVLVACPDRFDCLEVFGCEDPLAGLRELARKGARWAVIQDDHPAAAVFRTGGRVYRAHAPEVEIVHHGGADDAMLAGLIFGMNRGPGRAIAFAMACALHNLQRVEVGHLEPAACEALAQRIQVEELSSPRSPSL